MPAAKNPLLADLNDAQRRAVEHGDEPLLIVAGAGTGKTTTLSRRVAWLIKQGTPANRILLLTFTRRAAVEMLRRVDGLIRSRGASSASSSRPGAGVWGGTFHSTGTRLLRRYGELVGLAPEFTILDRSDAEDLLNVVRTDLGLSEAKRRFPLKGTCLAIYSRCVNRAEPLSRVLTEDFPSHLRHEDDLAKLFKGFGQRKEEQAVLDYDDLLVFWRALLQTPQGVEAVRGLFDCVLVDEYQDTNVLQADILKLLRPDGRGLTVVGDDSQSIYSFRAATVRNILDFPEQFPGTRIVTLEQNYRSTQPILDATNRVIAESAEWHAKELWSERGHGERPLLARCADEDSQTEFVIGEVLRQREEGVELKQQAVLFRASHHSAALEIELTRRDIPFRKYGGLKFVESAHVKDLLAILRLAENPRDIVAGTRVLLLLPGIGPARAAKLMDALREAGGSFDAWADFDPPAATGPLWTPVVDLFERLTGKLAAQPVGVQVEAALRFYQPILETLHDNAAMRLRDLEQLVILAARFADRPTFLTEITLDPPTSTADLTDTPATDEDDWLVLSTIHSAKGLEWDTVYVLHAADGSIPSDMAAGSPEQMEEERRLLYVALTRSRNRLVVCHPHRLASPRRGGFSGMFGGAFVPLSRFLTPAVLTCFEETVVTGPDDPGSPPAKVRESGDVRRSLDSLWS